MNKILLKPFYLQARTIKFFPANLSLDILNGMDRMLSRFSIICPYLPDRKACMLVMETTWNDEDYFIYENLLTLGWRRSGNFLYCYQCHECKRCIPIRIPCDQFLPSKSLNLIIKKNRDISVSILNAYYSDERLKLYEKYVRSRHSESVDHDATKNFYFEFMDLIAGSKAQIIEYRNEAGILLAEGFVDILPEGISSVYFAFDPDAGRRSLGRFSVNTEIQIAKQLQKSFYYLGFWVPGSPKMDYKADFTPFEIAVDALNTQNADSSPNLPINLHKKVWRKFSSRAEALYWLQTVGYLDR